MARRDVVAAVVLLAFTAGFGFLALRLPDRGLPNTPGPAFFPTLIATALAVLSIALLMRGVRAAATEPSALPTGVTARGWLALGMFVIYLVAMPTLGFLVTSIPFFAALTWAYGERRPVVLALTSVLVPAASLVVFRSGFQIFLPRGLWW